MVIEKCNICQKEFKNRKSLTNHRRWHLLPEFKEYQDKMKIREWERDEKNSRWKGDKAGYIAIHNWVRKRKVKPKLCEECKKKEPIDLASVDGSCKRDINNFKWLCRHCHMKLDYKLGLRQIVRPNVSKRKRDSNGKFLGGGS